MGNLSALWMNDPALARRIEQMDGEVGGATDKASVCGTVEVGARAAAEDVTVAGGSTGGGMSGVDVATGASHGLMGNVNITKLAGTTGMGLGEDVQRNSGGMVEGEAGWSSGHCRIETARDGNKTAAVTAADGRQVWLHSRYEPVAEAKRQIEKIDFLKTFVFFIHGMGLGYVAREVFERASDESYLCIFEPDLHILRAAIFSTDLQKMLASGRVMIYTTLDKGSLFTRFHPNMALVHAGTAQLSHGPEMQLNGAFFSESMKLVEDLRQYSTTAMGTLVINGRRTAENIGRNIGWYAAAPSLDRLKDKHKGQPAVIISAGPSLRKNKHLLKSIQDRAVLVAVQTTLKPMLELGVRPHYVTSLDYHEICTRFFENLPGDLQTELVAEPKANSAIFGMNPGPVSLLGNDFAEGLLKEMNLKKPVLTPGATVAHLAYYVADWMGCDPIIFVGQDLGFSDGLCYAPGTSYEDVWRPEVGRFCTMEMKQWEQIVRDRAILRRIEDCHGVPMYTEERLFTYLQQFERDFAQAKAKIIDASEGGAAKRGAEIMTLAEAIRQYCNTGKAIVADTPNRPAGEDPVAAVAGITKAVVGAGTPVVGHDISVAEASSAIAGNVNTAAEACSAIAGKTKSAAEGGASIAGQVNAVVVASSSEAAVKNASDRAAAGQSMRWDRLAEVAACIDKRLNEAREIESISRQTLPLLTEVRDHLEDQARVNKVIGRIDQLRQKMNDLGRTYELAMQFTQSTEMDRFIRDRELVASRATGMDRQRRQVSRDIGNVQGVMSAAAAFAELMAEVKITLEKQMQLQEQS